MANTDQPTNYYTKLDYLVHTLAILGYSMVVFEDDIAIFRDGTLVLIVQHGGQRKNR